jgi:hypothetical protein
VAKKPSWARTGQRALGGLLTSCVAQKEVGSPRGAASRPLALVARGELGVGAKLALLLLRCVRPKGGVPDQARRLASARFSEYPFCYESHARVQAPGCGGTATRSHGAAPAQECRLRLKRPPPKALPWFPPFKSSTPERFRGSCPFACSPAVANGKLVLPFWKEKLRSGLFFPSKTESKRFLQGGGKDQGEHGRHPACAG